MKHTKRLAAALAVLLLCGCAENPDSGIVVHKDMDKVIGEAENSADSRVDFASIRQNAAEHYETEISADKLHVSVKVNADIELPETENFSVLRVKQHEFTEADIDKYRSVLLGDTALYDFAAANQKTKRNIEAEIANARSSYESVIPQITDAHNREVAEKEYAARMAELEQQYSEAPEDAPMLPSDGRLHSNAEAYQADPGNSILKRRNELDPRGSTLQAVNESANIMFYVCSSPARGNLISYSVSPTAFQALNSTPYAIPDSLTVCTGRGAPANFIDHFQYESGKSYHAVEGDSCTLSQAQAEQQAQDLLERLGIQDFVLREGGRYAELMLGADEENTLYRTNYILRYVRSIDGVPLRQDSGAKYAQEDSGNYQTYYFPAEMIEIRIADAGLLSFAYYAPLDVTEVVVENAAMKPFSEIRSTFERMLPMTKAREDGIGAKIKISRVILGYSRISEKDSWNTGLVVPVWAFFGTAQKTDSAGNTIWDAEGSTEQVQICINAIDGSVIDSALGY